MEHYCSAKCALHQKLTVSSQEYAGSELCTRADPVWEHYVILITVDMPQHMKGIQEVKEYAREQLRIHKVAQRDNCCITRVI